MVGGTPPATPPPELPAVFSNDNRAPAGRLEGETLSISLVVRMATWHPDAGDGPSADVEAFAEEGKAPEIPGPLVRVREGTLIDATVRNDLADSTITVTGLATRPHLRDQHLGRGGRLAYLPERAHHQRPLLPVHRKAAALLVRLLPRRVAVRIMGKTMDSLYGSPGGSGSMP